MYSTSSARFVASRLALRESPSWRHTMAEPSVTLIPSSRLTTPSRSTLKPARSWTLSSSTQETWPWSLEAVTWGELVPSLTASVTLAPSISSTLRMPLATLSPPGKYIKNICVYWPYRSLWRQSKCCSRVNRWPIAKSFNGRCSAANLLAVPHYPMRLQQQYNLRWTFILRIQFIHISLNL